MLVVCPQHDVRLREPCARDTSCNVVEPRKGLRHLPQRNARTGQPRQVLIEALITDDLCTQRCCLLAAGVVRVRDDDTLPAFHPGTHKRPGRVVAHDEHVG